MRKNKSHGRPWLFLVKRDVSFSDFARRKLTPVGKHQPAVVVDSGNGARDGLAGCLQGHVLVDGAAVAAVRVHEIGRAHV